MRGVRLPFSFRQRVKHEGWPDLEFIVLTQELDESGAWTICVTDPEGGGWWQFGANELTFADLADEQADMAKWMGCTVRQMNRCHDRLHAWLAKEAGIPSYSLKVAAGEPLNEAEKQIAAAEEDAVLYVQRFLCAIENLLMKQAA